METLLTKKAASLTELREPGKVLEYAGQTPVAILNRNAVVAYLVPAGAVNGPHTKATTEEVLAAFDRRSKVLAPVLDYLKDK